MGMQIESLWGFQRQGCSNTPHWSAFIRSNPNSKDQNPPNPHKTSVSYEGTIHLEAFIFMNVFWSSQEPSRNPHKY